MQHKISTGITTIKLVDRREVTPSRFPKFIGELRFLRELTIDKFGMAMPYYRNIHQHIQQLPSTLKKLIIRVKNSHRAIFPPSPSHIGNTPHSALQMTAKESYDLSWSFTGAFPQLETLELDSLESWTPRDCDLLPSSITSLTLSLSDYVDDATIIQWPPLLVSLKIYSGVPNFLSFWTHLPPHLASLYLRAYSDDLPSPDIITSALPRSLARLEGGFDARLSLIDLPPGLESIDTHWIHNFDPNTAPIRRILPNLKRLTTRELTTQLVCSLPPTIQSIKADTMDDIIPRHQWPQTLTDLTVSCGQLHLFNFATSLPRSLLQILVTFNEFVGASIAYLPPRLTSLRLECSSWTSEEGLDLPFGNLPSSITDLQLESHILASQLKHLPPRLKTLVFYDLTIDYDFNPSDDMEIEAMMLRFEIGRRERILESFDFTQLKRASVLALLPRTLTKLTFERAGSIDDWTHLPPLIESFTSGDSHNLDFLRQLPHMTNLRSLIVKLDGVEEEHLHLVPKGLSSACLQFANSPRSLVIAALQYFPAWYILSHPEGHTLGRLRSEHVDDEDPSHFLSLLRPNRELLLDIFPKIT